MGNAKKIEPINEQKKVHRATAGADTKPVVRKTETEASLRRGLKEAVSGKVVSISQLWDGIE